MEQALDLAAVRRLLDQTEESIDELWVYINAKEWDKVDTVTAKIRSWIRTMKEDLPRDAVKSELRALEQHAMFLEKYIRQGNHAMARSNASSLRPDMERLRSTLKRLARGEGLLELSLDIGQVKNGSSQEYLDEACRCYEAAAYRAAIAMAGCALESEVREAYQKHFGTSSDRMPYAQVLEKLEKGKGLTPNETALLETAKGFRNLSAHPSGFKATSGEAQGIIQLALEQLKKAAMVK